MKSTIKKSFFFTQAVFAIICTATSRPFSMPLATEDFAAIDRQRHEEFEVQVREEERQRQEIERLHAELNGKK